MLERRDFPEVISDNEEIYFLHLCAVIDSVDELALSQVRKFPGYYTFRISPSLPKYVPLLLEEILKLHNVFGIHLDISKSIKTSGVIVFSIRI